MKSDIVLTTDFGLSTGFVGSMTGVIRNIDQTLAVFDLNHEIRPFDMKQASGLLADTIPYWKSGTVFVCVVDPGVGTSRRSCVTLLDNGSYVVTPDNGTLTAFFENIKEVRQIDETVNRLPGSGASQTFHGRDVYAYTAGRLAAGIIDFPGVGPKYSLDEIVRYTIPTCTTKDNYIEGVFTGCLRHFGSPTTNIGIEDFRKCGFELGQTLLVTVSKDSKILFKEDVLFHKSFGFVAQGESILYNGGTSPFIEIGINKGKFADKYFPSIYEEDPNSFKIVIEKQK